MAKKKNGDEKEISPEEKARQEQDEEYRYEGGFDIRDNFAFLLEYEVDYKHLGMIFIKAVIDAKDYIISKYTEDSPEKARRKRLKAFQERIRDSISESKVAIRWAGVKGKTAEDVLGEFDDIYYRGELEEIAVSGEGSLRGIENILLDLLQMRVPLADIGKAVENGARTYRRKHSEGHVYSEARSIRDSLESYLTEVIGGSSD